VQINMNNKLGKQYKLCSKIVIESIFETGSTVKSHPFIARIKLVESEDSTPFKIAFSAPKKTFRFAHERNRIKRICKESVRSNKTIIESYLQTQNKQLVLFLIYATKEELKHDKLQKSTSKLFHKIITKLEEHEI
jgi:ribonuclease P protein component